jgi:predicted ribosomally synthesized peptide with SipW-like signal peptide
MSRKHLKRYLMLLSAVGLLAIGTAGSGTFASFSAEVASPNNYFATGTLFLHATKDPGGTACKSEVVSDNANILSTNGCDVLFNLSNISAGQTANVNLQLDNAGSLDATAVKFALGSSGCVDGKSTITTIAAGGVLAAATTININAITYTLFKGTVINISDGGSSETATLNADAPAGQGFVVVNTPLANAHSAGVKIQWNQQFTPATTLCSGLLFTIQEKNAAWASNQKCIYPTLGGVGCSFTGAPNVSAITTSLNDLTSDLWSGGPNAGSPLKAGMSRFITINIKAPATFANNGLQNRSALFDLLWHIES